MSSRLSVCLLTRDEERNIERAIRSVEGISDEVVVADAGSTDRTEEIARGLGARFVGPKLGVLVGKLAADVLFYMPVVFMYERKRRWRGPFGGR